MEKRCQVPFTSQAVNKTSISTYRSKFMTLDIGIRRIHRWVFTIADVPFTLIGADFLSHFHLTVDIHRHKLIDNQTKLFIHGIQSIDQSPCPIVAVTDNNCAYQRLLAEFPDITQPTYKETVIKHTVTHHINTKEPSVVSRARRLAPDRLKLAKAEFDQMLQLGIFLPSDSSWSSLLHMVPQSC